MSAIDIKDATKIEANLRKLRKNSSTIVIAHKLAVARNADIIFVLKVPFKLHYNSNMMGLIIFALSPE